MSVPRADFTQYDARIFFRHPGARLTVSVHHFEDPKPWVFVHVIRGPKHISLMLCVGRRGVTISVRKRYKQT